MFTETKLIGNGSFVPHLTTYKKFLCSGQPTLETIRWQFGLHVIGLEFLSSGKWARPLPFTHEIPTESHGTGPDKSVVVFGHNLNPMDRLPKVLQNEIWEYVRGDRAYWKQQFQPVIHNLTPVEPRVWWQRSESPLEVMIRTSGCGFIRMIIDQHSIVCVYPWVRGEEPHRMSGLCERLKREFPLLFF
jgi:hypothetical protein